MKKLDQRSRFSAVVTGADVTRGKPDPQVFQIAADRLGVEPASCVVVEDAPAGIAAARAAGMVSIALVGTVNADALADAVDRGRRGQLRRGERRERPGPRRRPWGAARAHRRISTGSVAREHIAARRARSTRLPEPFQPIDQQGGQMP